MARLFTTTIKDKETSKGSLLLNVSRVIDARAYDYVYVQNLATARAVTGINTGTETMTSASHGLIVGDIIRFATIGGETGLTVGVDYYVKTVADANSMIVSLTFGGTAADLVYASGDYPTWQKIADYVGDTVLRYSVGERIQTHYIDNVFDGTFSGTTLGTFTHKFLTLPVTGVNGVGFAHEHLFNIREILRAIQLSSGVTLSLLLGKAADETVFNSQATVTTTSVDTGTEIITKTGHGFLNGDRLYVAAIGTVTGVSVGDIVYVINKTNDTFKISTTSGGSAINLSGTTSAMGFNRIPANGLANGDALIFSALTGGTGLAANTLYYVISNDGYQFKVSASKGGTAIDITADITAGVLTGAGSTAVTVLGAENQTDNFTVPMTMANVLALANV